MLEYARLDLLREIKMGDGVEAHTLVVKRPNAQQFSQIAIGDTVLERFDKFVSQCCKVLNGTGEELEVHAAQLDGVDGGEVADIIAEMREDADRVTVEETGNGIDEPFGLLHPLTLGEDTTITDISFPAQRL